MESDFKGSGNYFIGHELTGAKTESKISGIHQELVGRKHAFTYDNQGNRLTHSRNSHTTSYTTNNLNQYTARTNHGFLLVEGTSTNATVKVYETDATEVTATRKNNYYFRDWDPDTTSTASDYPAINVKEGTTVSATKNAWIPAVSETPITYDANGNLTADALWSYTYDEDGARQRVDGAPQSGVPGAKPRVRKAGAPWATDEQNRLITMEETSAAATAGFPDTTITFKYDYLGRRVEKKVVRGTVTESHLRFVWRGWHLAHSSPKSSTALRNVGTGTGIVRCASLQGVDPASPAPPLETRSSTRPSFARFEFCEISGPVAELNAASDNALVKTYTWGPDISGSFGGAGGNGGVLIFKDHTSTVNESFYPAYDAQGNVTGLIDTAGNLDAAYEYDSFGKLIRYAGTRSASMSLLYRTKYTDMESGIIYYGYRYYDPRQGRFINRDPINEEGGINLYGFVGNNPVNAIEFLGLCNSEGDIDPKTGEEICSDVYELQPFTVDEETTDEDLRIWAFQDILTERTIEELNSLALNRQNNADNGNSSPDKDIGTKKENEEEEEDNEKTDCENFVDSLVSDYVAQAQQSIAEGNTEIGYHLGSNWLAIRHTDLSSWTGFRPELTAGGQEGDVSRHIYGHAGVMLKGSLTYGYIGSYFNQAIDYFQRFKDGRTALESQAEIAGDQAGRAVALAVSESAFELLDWGGSYPNIERNYNASRIQSNAEGTSGNLNLYI